MRIGILTLPLHVNYGGILQAAALYRLLSDKGFAPVLLRKEPENLNSAGRLIRNLLRMVPAQNLGGVRVRAKARAKHEPFIQRFIPNVTRPCHNGDELRAAIERSGLDAVVVGSDQVWRLDFHQDNNHAAYFLNFVPPGVKKLSYAASFGYPEWRHPDLIKEVSSLLAGFDAVSVREQSGVDICRTTFGREECALVLDPTLVVDPTFYAEAAAPSEPRSRPSLVTYVLAPGASSKTVLKAIEAALPEAYDVTSLSCDWENRQVTVGEWLRAFMDADFVFTDSFHGTVLSILFGKRFIVLGDRDRGLDRLTTLLGSIGLMCRLVLADDLARVAALVSQRIDYEPVNARLTALRRASRDYLFSALAQTNGQPSLVSNSRIRSFARPGTAPNCSRDYATSSGRAASFRR